MNRLNKHFEGIILASQSPRRKKLMEKLGIPFVIQTSKFTEFPPMGDLPNAYSSRMALEKAITVGSQFPDHLVIGADTVVAVDDHIMGKPKNNEEAALMLSRLSNRWHEVWTGICVYNQKRDIEVVKAIRSSVCFKKLSENDIEDYILTGEPMDKAGAYAIQEGGKGFVKEIQGSYHNIIGLPTLELSRILYELGVESNFTSPESAY